MIKVINAKKTYQEFKMDCSMQIESGRITALIGDNGAGKSTLFKSILGIVSLESGEVLLNGTEVGHLKIKDKINIGAVFSDSGFNEVLTITEIICILQSMYKKFDLDMFRLLCEQFKLPLNKKIAAFSAGMKAKLKTIIAITHEAEVLILDEVTSGLDVIARNEVLDLLREYIEKKEDSTILISSHISSDLETLCDDLYMMKSGKIIFYATVDEVMNDYGVLKLTASQYEKIEKEYLLAFLKEPYGYRCIVKERKYFKENNPEIILEKVSIDDLVFIMNKGEVVL